MNNFSVEVNKVIAMASEIAYGSDAKNIEPIDFIMAMFDVNNVAKNYLENTGAKKQFKDSCDEALENREKISEQIKNMYKEANQTRRLRLSCLMQTILVQAEQIEKNEPRNMRTGKLECHHVFKSIYDANDETDENGKKIGHICTPLNNFTDVEVQRLFNEMARAAIENNDPDEEQDDYDEKPSAKKEYSKNWNKYCTDLVEKAVNDSKPFIGRDQEIFTLMQCLLRRDKPNAILVGAPGVGKTDIIRGMAKKIADHTAPDELRDVQIFSVDVAGMLAGSEFRGSFEDRLKQVVEEASKMKRPILFFDEIHTLMGAGKGIGTPMDAANILKPYLTEGKIRVVGATTEDEFRNYVESDNAFMRRFQTIRIAEPSAKDAVQILKGISNAYENFHGIKINQNAIETAVNMSVRYMHDRFLPDKAIDIIDQTCARVKMDHGKKVMKSDIETTIADLIHVPVQQMQTDEMSKLRKLDKDLKKVVFGQDEAIDEIVEAVQMSKAGLGDEEKPIGSFLFVGPSGVGKTEVSKQLAEKLGIEFVRFDMSEYAESHTIAKLIGSPAGYVGYEDGGILVEKIRQNPHCVVLFDEIEKAHPEIYKIFLQILDYGMLTDNKGRKADFRNTIIIMTSNAGNASCEKPKLGFGSKQDSDRKSASLKAVQNMMAPELRGRLTATVVFNSLNEEVSTMIVNKELKNLTAKLKAKGISVTYSDEAIKKLVEKGISTQYGAREIQRVINQEIKTIFVKKIVAGKTADSYLVSIKDDKFIAEENEKDEASASPESEVVMAN